MTDRSGSEFTAISNHTGTGRFRRSSYCFELAQLLPATRDAADSLSSVQSRLVARDLAGCLEISESLQAIEARDGFLAIRLAVPSRCSCAHGLSYRPAQNLAVFKGNAW